MSIQSLGNPVLNPAAFLGMDSYTARGQLDTATDWLENVTAYDYDLAGRLTGVISPNGVSGALSYDAAGRLTGIAYDLGGTPLESISYTLNAAGLRTSMTDGSGTTTWSYDALDRLIEAAYPNSDVLEYGYDAVGNRVSLTVNGVTTTSAFDAGNRLTASGSATYGYDHNGNLTSMTDGGVTTTYAYDALNRLTSVASGGSTIASYAYNGDGLRVGKTVGGVISDGERYVWGHGLIGRVDAGSTATYAHQDGLGSVRLIVDPSGHCATDFAPSGQGAPGSPHQATDSSLTARPPVGAYGSAHPGGLRCQWTVDRLLS
jgi:YD repeat-containing protein